MDFIRNRRILSLAVALMVGGFALVGQAREAEFAAVRLHARKAETLLERYASSSIRDSEIRRELGSLAQRLDRAQAALTPAPLPGFSEEAYISPIDGSAQPFFRYLPSAWKADDKEAPASLPLLVYLHGYSPNLDLITWPVFPAALTNLAERLGFCVAYPFGRSNTDFQGIGEQDVLTVMDLMHGRYGTDASRVVLLGYSMGGMGAYTLGARFAERFNGLLILCGRGDYAVWQRLELESLPAWERELVDAQFLSGQARRLAGMPILAYQGTADFLVRPEEARAAFRLLEPFNPEARLVMLPGADHWIAEEVLEREDCADWLERVTAAPRADRPEPLGILPGEVPSRLQNAFLAPFLFVQSTPQTPEDNARFEAVCGEWFSFAKAHPRRRHEAELAESDRRDHNLFLFGEPEGSPLIARLFGQARIEVEPDALVLQGRRFPRAERGLWVALPSPFAKGRTVVVQCGVAWGKGLPSNHKYDLLPDLLVYTPEAGRIGINLPVAAARVLDDGTFDWYPAPLTEP